MRRGSRWWLCLAVVASGWAWGGAMGCGGSAGGPSTVAEVEVVRPAVSVDGHATSGIERLGPGAAVATDAGARAFVRHDRGPRLLVDVTARVRIRDEAVEVEAGRAWVESPAGAAGRVVGAGVALDPAGASLEVERAGSELKIYVARGTVAYRLGDGDGAKSGEVHAGESAQLSDKEAKVKPALLWDDWTGGLAWPDPSGAQAATGRGEIGARSPGSLGEARFPLVITRLEVRTRVEDDLAVTRVVESFFNPASETLEGLYRLHVPEGAVLQRFAIDRNGRWADGYVKERETARAQYQAQVYQGSTKDPALLEWEAPGSYRARIYPIPAGATRKILVEYSEWMVPHGDGGKERTFRYPLGGDPNTVIQELDIEVDAKASGATSLRAGLGARIEGTKAVLERTDFRPQADLVVDLVGPSRSSGEARSYRSPHRILSRIANSIAREDDYFLLRALPLATEPARERPPLDLVIVTDVSAATDATHLQLARTSVEALVRHLDGRDRVAIVGADLDLHAPGAAGKGSKLELLAADRAHLDEMLDALARQGTGGATDLGAVLTQAAALLSPARNGAVVYIGDAAPTVGELDMKALRERIDRLPAPLRLYGVAVGDEANLGLLEGLASDGGLALRVGDRTQAAGAALRILGHASRRAAYRVEVDLGSGVDRVYPRRKVTVVEGDTLPVLARVRTGVPSEVTISGMVLGKPFTAKYNVKSERIGGGDDLRLRWAQERLRQLLADGASAEEVAELGTRQNLITPFTSYYVPSADELSLLLRGPVEVRAAGCAKYERAPAPEEGESDDRVARFARPTGASGPSSGESGGSEGKMGNRNRREPAADKKAQALAREQAETEMKDEEAKPAEPAAAANAAPTLPSPSTPGTAMAQPPPPPAADPAPEKPSSAMAGYGGAARGAKGDSGGDDFGRFATTRSTSAPVMKSPAKEAPKEAKQKMVERARHAGMLGVLRSNNDGTTLDVLGGDEDDGNVVDSDHWHVRIDIFTHRPRHCSAASQLGLADRAVLWRERLGQRRGVERALEIWQDATQGCELKTWADRRELLRAMLGSVGGAGQMVQLWRRMEEDPAAQDFLRRAVLASVKTPSDLRVVYEGMGLSEDVKWSLVEELLAKAQAPEARVAVLSQLGARWPGDLRLKLKLMEAYEAAGKTVEARRLAEAVRAAPNADAQARTAVGELFVRLGDEVAARRVFSEIVEFAPQDPVARRRLGDLYRAHGWFEEAYRQYQTLAALAPGDPAVLLLQAAAAAGAGRIDEALRLEQRVADGTEPGSETGTARVALWWSALRLALLRDGARQAGDEAELARLLGRTRRANVLQDARPLHLFLTWAHPEADCELMVQLPGSPLAPATDVAPEFGMASASSRDPLVGEAIVEVRRPPGASSSGLRYRAELVVLWDEGTKNERLMKFPVEFGPGKEVVRVRVASDKAEVLQ